MCETKNNEWKRLDLSIPKSIDNHAETTRIRPNFAGLNNSQKCQKLYLCGFPAFILQNGSSLALFVGRVMEYIMGHVFYLMIGGG